MTTGALIFAYNNDVTDYVRMASWTADNIRRHLDIPVAVVTDKPPVGNFDRVVLCQSESTNQRWFDDYGAKVSWNNANRVNAYELSPWDTTLVIDADYVVASDQLKVLFECDQDFLAHRWAMDVTGQDNFESLNYFGHYRMPMWWATVMLFRRSQHARLIFDTMQMVKDNWAHYRHIYKNFQATYRNDHALTIALGIVNGHTLDHPGIPWRLPTLMPLHKLKQLDQDRYRIDFTAIDNRSRWIEIDGMDFHAMGKQQLGDIVANNT